MNDMLAQIIYGLADRLEMATPLLVMGLAVLVIACFLWINSAWTES